MPNDSQFWPGKSTMLKEFAELKRKTNLVLRMLLEGEELSVQDRQAIREELNRP